MNLTELLKHDMHTCTEEHIQQLKANLEAALKNSMWLIPWTWQNGSSIHMQRNIFSWKVWSLQNTAGFNIPLQFCIHKHTDHSYAHTSTYKLTFISILSTIPFIKTRYFTETVFCYFSCYINFCLSKVCTYNNSNKSL